MFLGTATPGDVPGNFHSALAALADRATYFYSAGGQVLVRPAGEHLAARAKDQAERLPVEEVYAEIARAPRRARPRPAARSPASTSAPRTRPTSPTSTRRAWSSCTPSSRTSAASATPTRSRSPRRDRASRRGKPDVPQHARLPRRRRRPHRGARALGARVPRLVGDPRQGGRPQPHHEPAQPGDRAAGEGQRDDRRAAARRLPVGARPDRAADRDPGDEGRRPGDVAGRARQPPPRQRRRAHRSSTPRRRSATSSTPPRPSCGRTAT